MSIGILKATRLFRLADKEGFELKHVEQALWLLKILEGFCKHSCLGQRVVFKGGTGLNIFMWAVPRLSEDIDLNYAGELDREKML